MTKRFFEFLILAALFVTLNMLLSPGMELMGGDAAKTAEFMYTSYKWNIIFSISKIFLGGTVLCLLFSSALTSFPLRKKIGIFFVFLVLLFLKHLSIYPATMENSSIVKNYNFARSLLELLSGTSEKSFARLLLFYGPWASLLLTFAFHLKNYRKTSKKRWGFSTFTNIYLLWLFFPSFSYNLSQNKNTQRPHVFIIGIDSLRHDRLSEEKYKNVMPFMSQLAENRILHAPLATSIARTFPSWMEISTCKYGITTNLRTMFPRKRERLQEIPTLFSHLKKQGYATGAVSDFAGDIFPRFNFGFENLRAPTSDINTLVESIFISSIPLLQAALIHPNLVYLFPSVQESAQLSDPRVLTQLWANQLDEMNSSDHPVVSTIFFSTAHFPYSVPAPYHLLFQKNEKGHIVFQKQHPQSKRYATGAREVEIPAKEVSEARAMFDASLRSIDDSLKIFFQQLESKGWLKNAIVVLLGDHGENLYEGNLGMGHGDGVNGDYGTMTSLSIWKYGSANTSAISNRFVRTIDVTPTILGLLNEQQIDHCDGRDVSKPIADDPSAYQESGIWFLQDTKTDEGKARLAYPNVTESTECDHSYRNEFMLKSNLVETLYAAKERAWITPRWRFVVRQSPQSSERSLYNRELDPEGAIDLLKTEKDFDYHKNIALKLEKELHHFLEKRGVEIVPLENDQTIYAETKLK